MQYGLKTLYKNMQIMVASNYPILRLACPQAIIQLRLGCHTDRMKHNFNILEFPEKLKSYNKQLLLYNHGYKSTSSYQFRNLTRYLLWTTLTHRYNGISQAQDKICHAP